MFLDVLSEKKNSKLIGFFLWKNEEMELEVARKKSASWKRFFILDTRYSKDDMVKSLSKVSIENVRRLRIIQIHNRIYYNYKIRKEEMSANFFQKSINGGSLFRIWK